MSDDEVLRKTPEEHLADARRAVPAKPPTPRRRWSVSPRGMYLLSMGAMYIVVALPLMGVTEPQQEIEDKFGLPLDIAGAVGIPNPDQALAVWGTLWALSGVAAILAGLWPGQQDAWGFYSLWIFSAAWGTLNVYGGVVLGYNQEAWAGSVDLLTAASVLVVSGMSETPSVYQSRRHRRGRTG